MVKPIPWDMPESLIDSEGVRARSTISAIPRLNTVPVARPNRIAIQTAQSSGKYRMPQQERAANAMAITMRRPRPPIAFSST